MEITWHGGSCFRLTERSLLTVLTNPHPHGGLKLKADAITCSSAEMKPHADKIAPLQRNEPYIVYTPGEYELGGVFITARSLKPARQKQLVQVENAESREHDLAEAKPETKRVPTTIACAFNYEGLIVLHLGDFSTVPSQADLDAFGTVDILLVSVSLAEHHYQSISEVVRAVEPSIVIPMNYNTLEDEGMVKFLKDMGISSPKVQDAFKVSRSSLPEDTQIVCLSNKNSA